jgi:hypothetical protein
MQKPSFNPTYLLTPEKYPAEYIFIPILPRLVR